MLGQDGARYLWDARGGRATGADPGRTATGAARAHERPARPRSQPRPQVRPPRIALSWLRPERAFVPHIGVRCSRRASPWRPRVRGRPLLRGGTARTPESSRTRRTPSTYSRAPWRKIRDVGRRAPSGPHAPPVKLADLRAGLDVLERTVRSSMENSPLLSAPNASDDAHPWTRGAGRTRRGGPDRAQTVEDPPTAA